MIDVICSHGPLAVGETRVLQVAGNGPFTVAIGHFVTDPPPVGLKEDSNLSVAHNESFEVRADDKFWAKRKGGLQIDITDADGAKRRVHFNVQAASRGL